MVRLMKDLLAQSARETFVGRTFELQALAELLNPGPRLIFLHGIAAGVEKSALLSFFAERARTQGAAVIELDCRAIELLSKSGDPSVLFVLVFSDFVDRLLLPRKNVRSTKSHKLSPMKAGKFGF